MPYIGNPPANRFVAPKAASVFSGNGSNQNFTLDHSVGSDEDILVSVDGVIQEPSVAYSVSGTTLSFTAAPSSNSGNNIFVYYLFRTVGTVSHPSNNALTATNGTLTGTLDVTGAITGSGTITGGGLLTTGGNIVIPDAGNIGSASDTDAMSISSGGVVTFSQTPVGAFISEADMFRLTSDTSNGANADITANLERVDDATFSKIGTGMTESSGIFTFPSTGLYQVICNPRTIAVSDNNVNVQIQVSSDTGSSFDIVATATGGGGGSSFDSNCVFSSAFVNVTNASTFQVKFTTNSFGASCRLVGSTTNNTTNFVFIKLGASQ